MYPDQPRGNSQAIGPRAEAGFSVTEMLVAMMILTVGVLGLFQLFATTASSTAVSASRVTARQLGTSELERVRSLRFDQISMTAASDGTGVFEDRPEVVGGSSIEPVGQTTRNGTEFSIRRHVTWKNVTVGGVEMANGFKLITVFVSWQDRFGVHELRFDSGVAAVQSNG